MRGYRESSIGRVCQTGGIQNNPKNHINVVRWSMWLPRFDLGRLWNRDRWASQMSPRAILRCFSPAAVHSRAGGLPFDRKSHSSEMLHRLNGPAQRRINRPRGLRNAARKPTGSVWNRLPLLSRLSR